MAKRIYSLETEYALMQEGLGTHHSTGDLFDQIEEVLKEQHQTVVCDTVGPRNPAHRSSGMVELKEGFFIDAGSRIYYDTGHFEWACAESDCARNATIWDLAANVELENAARQAARRLGTAPGGRVLVIKNNFDYATKVTYGCHENYSISRQLSERRDSFGFLTDALAAFLVTRTILCGAGRLGATSEDPDATVAFQISQRADFIEKVVSRDTRDGRAILNERDESLADANQYRRLHLILGDSNLSPWSTFLKLGTTGLILDAIEQGSLKDPPILQSPVQALREISRDLDCKKRYPLRNAPPETAVQIQRRYWLAAANTWRTTPPDEEKNQILQLWSQALDDIAADPSRLADRADWRLKLRFFDQEVLPRLRTSWEEIRAWSWIIAKTATLPLPHPSTATERWLRSALPSAGYSVVSAVMANRGLNWIDYARQRKNYFTLRAIDIRFHDLDRHLGFFWQRYHGHSLLGITSADIEAARREPPRRTRAWLRGRILGSSRSSRVESMDWDRINLKNGDSIPLPDPFATRDRYIEQLFALSPVEEGTSCRI